MQEVNYRIDYLTGKGWKHLYGSASVDETLGLKAGRDVYAATRGTIMRKMRKMCTPSDAWVWVDDIRISISFDGRKFTYETCGSETAA